MSILIGYLSYSRKVVQEKLQAVNVTLIGLMPYLILGLEILCRLEHYFAVRICCVCYFSHCIFLRVTRVSDRDYFLQLEFDLNIRYAYRGFPRTVRAALFSSARL